jgi:two-component system, NtrC family, sensor kinase
MKQLNQDKLFKLSFEHASCGKIIIDMSGKIIMVNRVLCGLLGYTEDELLKLNSKDLTPQDACDAEKKEIAKLCNDGVLSVKYNTTNRQKSGQNIELEVNAIAIDCDEECSLPRLILKQIERKSAQKSLEKEIEEKQFYLEKIMDEMPAHIYFKDLQSRFLLTNKSMLKLFGVNTLDELIGRTDFDFFAGEHAQQAFSDEQEIIRTKKEIKKVEKEVWPNGTITWVHTTKKPLYNKEGVIIGTFGISKDITETKKAEQALKDAHEELERKNKELNVTLENLKETQSQLINAEKLAVLGQLIAGIAHEINTPLGAINASTSNIKSSLLLMIESIEEVFIKFTPEEIEAFKKILSNAGKNNINQLISKEKRALKKELAEKLLLKGYEDSSSLAESLIYINQYENSDWLTDNRAIDLYKVLRASKNIVSLIRNSDNIETATNKASQVVLALKKYIHRTPDGEKTPTDISDNIETVITLNHNNLKKGVEVIKNYQPIPLVKAYPDELNQVWNNLITNAIHAMNNNGTLTIDLFSNNKMVVIRFTDTGSGIPENIIDKIFIPFFTTKSSGEGTGIGLDIVKRIVEKHEGNIKVDSEIGKGTTFTIEIPIN